MSFRDVVAVLAALLVAGVVGSCAAQPSVTDRPTDAGPTDAPASPASPARPQPGSPSADAGCPGATWPPFEPAAIPGLTAAAPDRARVVITNATGETYHYRISAWEPARFEACEALLEAEIERGPIESGSEVRSTVGQFVDRSDVPITIAFWDGRCGEACQRPPIGGILLVRPARQPPAS